MIIKKVSTVGSYLLSSTCSREFQYTSRKLKVKRALDSFSARKRDTSMMMKEEEVEEEDEKEDIERNKREEGTEIVS